MKKIFRWMLHFSIALFTLNCSQGVNELSETQIIDFDFKNGEAMADGFKKNFVPESKEILVAFKLIKSGEVDVVKFMAPEKPDPKKEMLPVAWVRNYYLESGASGRVFTTTHGASEDFLNEGFRRMLINATLWSMGMENEIKANNNVEFVGPYKPTTFNFGGYKANVKPSDLSGWESLIMPGEVVKKSN